MNNMQTQKYLQASAVFSTLTAADISALATSATLRSFERNQIIFCRDDPAEFFFLILEGWVKISRDTSKGEEAVLGVFHQGETFGDTSLSEGATHPYNAQATEKTRLLAIPGLALRRQAYINPAILFRIMESMSTHMDRLRIENEHMALMSAPQRIGCLLLQFASQPGARSDGITYKLSFPYDKSLAAARLGMKPETFSRGLAQLKKAGVCVKGNEVSIANLPDLVDFCCSECSTSNSCTHTQNACERTECKSFIQVSA